MAASKKKTLTRKAVKKTVARKATAAKTPTKATAAKAAAAKAAATKATAAKAAATKAAATKAAATKAAATKAAATKATSTKATSTKTPSKAAATKTPAKTDAPKKPRVFTMSFASVYPLYVQKAEAKGRTRAEVDAVIAWLTGYQGEALQRALDARVDLETFFAQAPRLNPNAALITGVVCGVRVEDVADPLMRKIRYLDKLVDELARGKKLASVLRE
jgi:hypothetical protein